MKELVLKENSIDEFLNECCIVEKNKMQGVIYVNKRIHYAIKTKCDLTSVDKVVFRRDEMTDKTMTEIKTKQSFLVKEYDDYCWELVLEE